MNCDQNLFHFAARQLSAADWCDDITLSSTPNAVQRIIINLLKNTVPVLYFKQNNTISFSGILGLHSIVSILYIPIYCDTPHPVFLFLIKIK